MSVSLMRDSISSLALDVLTKQMSLVDVLLTVSSPSLALMIFMLPRSGVLEIVPRAAERDQGSGMAASCDLLYYSHHSLEAPNAEAEQDEEFEAFIDSNSLWVELKDLQDLVRRNKYRFSSV